MDSDIHFKEKRPHILYVNKDVLTSLVISSANADRDNKRKNKKMSLEAAQPKVELFNRSLEIGVLLPVDDQLKSALPLPLPLHLPSEDSPQLVQSVLLGADETGADPTMFDVCLKSDVVEKLALSSNNGGTSTSLTKPGTLKRKRTPSKKTATAAQKHILFTLQVLDEFQALNRELPFLVKSFPKNYKVYVDGPRLELSVISSDQQQLKLSGRIKYSFSVYDTINSIGIWSMRSQTLQSLISLLVDDETFALSTASLTPQISHSGFYEAISKNKTKPTNTPRNIYVPHFNSSLFKFQRETVHWCLRREGKDLLENGSGIIDLDPDVRLTMVAPPECCWRRIVIQGKVIMVNPYTGVICSQEMFNLATHENHPAIRPVSGGLLAEEMGLGKTLEMIALVVLHKRPQHDIGVSFFDNFAARTVTKCKTTLIVSPAAISSQWVREIGIHAPTLKVYYYQGAKKLKGSVKSQDLSEYDIVVTTYSVIAHEVHFAQFNPEARNTRQANKIHPDLEAKKSPLMQLEFWRVILDEAQMVSSGINGAAKVAEMLPRVHSWAVTGTPVRRQLNDLQGLMVFFRLSPFSISNRAWAQLLATDDFEQLFSNLSIRHTAFMVRHDLNIPPQSRVSVHLSFNSIEETNYSCLYSEFLYNMGLELKPNGRIGYIAGANPAAAGGINEDQNEVDLASQLDYGKLVSWFERLRQACSLPRPYNDKRSFVRGAASTIEDLLDGMLEQAESQLSNQQRKYYSSVIERGRLREALRQPKEALDLWLYALAGVEKIVEMLRAEVAKAKEEEQLKKKAKEQEDNGDVKTEEDTNKVKEEKPDETDDAEEDDDDDVKERKARLRSWVEVLHRCYFLVATANYQLAVQTEESQTNLTNTTTSADDMIKAKEESSEEDATAAVRTYRENENRYYELAEHLRKELLREPILKVNNAMEKLKSPKTGKPKKLVTIPMVAVPESNVPELVLEDVSFQLFNERAKALDKQASLIAEWREQLWNLSLEKLVDQNADPDGEEYGESLDAQEKAFCYLEVLQGLISDRSETFTGSSDPVVNNPVRFERNKTANSRKNDIEGLNNGTEGGGSTSRNITTNVQKSLLSEVNQHAQKSDFQLELEKLRKDYSPIGRFPLLNSLLGIATRAKTREFLVDRSKEQLQAELMEEGVLPQLQKNVDDNMKALKAIQRELTGFRNVYNARVEYYRRLQELSDTVTPLELPEESNVAMSFVKQFVTKHKREEEELLAMSERVQSRITYLNSLKKRSEDEDDDSKQEGEICVICQEVIVNGSLTVCGHRFCRACLQQWWNLQEKCPVCKTPLNITQIYNYRVSMSTVTKLDVTHGSETSTNPTSSSPSSSSSSSSQDPNTGHHLARSNPIYREVDKDTLNAIINDTSCKDTGFGTKLDVIVKHLHWLRSKEPDAQVVIFSQWANMLNLLSDILTRRGILHATVKSNMEEFRRDKSYACFLLHAKHESAGLTLVNATHVYLCEPLVNTALEVQAISRIHRIGQTKPTTVWLFVASDTVEEAVLKLSTTNRLRFLKSSSNLPGNIGEQQEEGEIEMIEGVSGTEEEPKQLTNDELNLANSHELAKTMGQMVRRSGRDHPEVVDMNDLCKVLFSYHYQRGENS